MEQLKRLLKIGSPPPKYSETFKKQVVREFEKGLLNKDELKAKYSIRGKSVVLQWVVSTVDLHTTIQQRMGDR